MGFLQIYTGSGKGKTTAAFGLALRSAGRGRMVFIGQFLKHEPSGEALAMRIFPTVRQELFGSPRSVYDPVSAEDVRAAAAGMEVARAILSAGEYHLVILDELNVAVAKGLVPVDDVLALVSSLPEGCDLVVTGREAHPRLLEAADLVTEMLPRRHYIDRGVTAREGIEF